MLFLDNIQKLLGIEGIEITEIKEDNNYMIFLLKIKSKYLRYAN